MEEKGLENGRILGSSRGCVRVDNTMTGCLWIGFLERRSGDIEAWGYGERKTKRRCSVSGTEQVASALMCHSAPFRARVKPTLQVRIDQFVKKSG